MLTILKTVNYLDLTWDLLKRKGRDAFNGQCVVPSLVN